ncbi:MAG: hypothetical protein ABIN91_18875 [Mucilaginibacter sp.]|uniref:OmpP1/FadL family transporter n=1 Tax=Mucilaginibacter sp. TaxID=1882438 RepID=UPI0032645A18
MKTKHILTVVAIVAITQTSYAQYSQDAIRFSTSQTGSTARIKAIGNAQTAVGGDMSNISGNPAGLGFFTKSELSITPEFNKFGASTYYLGQGSESNTSNLNFNNASAVLYSRLNTPSGGNKEQGWLSFNVGASYNRTNDFYQTINYNGNNTANSISNYYANLANGQGVDVNNPYTLQDWAYVHNLIDQYSNGGPTYQSNVFPYNSAAGSKTVNQTNSITREGGQTEFSISGGANYSNTFYLGFGIGITSLRYNSINTFTETGTASVLNSSNVPTNSNYVSSYSQNQATTGSGFNARLGFIYKPDPAVRIGATLTTPTWYTIDDDYSEGLNTNYKTGVIATYANGPADYPLTYNFHTPLKVSGGVAVFLGTVGFITGDVEYLDYSSTRLTNADGYDASNDNHDIKSLYRSTVNAHAGAEVKLDQLYLRGGYGIQGNPQRNYGSDLKTISGGLGYRFMNYYIDATYTNVQGTQSIFPYTTTTLSPQADVSKTYDNVFVTFGLRF